MVARQIKPRPTPPPRDIENLATAAEKAEAKQLSKRKPSTAVGWLCFFILLFLLNYVFGATNQGNQGLLSVVLLLSILFGVIAPHIVAKVIELSVFSDNLGKIVINRLRNEQDRENQTVTAAVIKVERIYGAQENNVTTLDSLLDHAETAIDQAQRLFKERAYTPFWDSIEDAVELLRQFDKRVGLINESAIEYYSQLAGREHTFPAFPVKSEDLPNPEALMKRLTERIAEAQRDFQFSSIFEQRRTTSAIVTGFRNTQEAITRLRSDIVSSLSNLQSSLESGLEKVSSNIRDGFDDLAESHQQSATELRETLDRHAKESAERDSKHQKFTEGALDNIQNHRKPRITETKEPFRSK